VLGLISVGGGIVGGIVTMFKVILRNAEKEKSFGIEMLPTAFVEALTKLLEALIKAPVWLALVIIGILLIFGSNLV
jgi:hypothetical protein